MNRPRFSVLALAAVGAALVVPATAQISAPGQKPDLIVAPAGTKKPGNEPLRPAYDALQKGDLKLAKKLFQNASDKDPNDLLPKLGLADVAYRAGELDESEKILRAAAKQHDLDSTVHVALGRYLYARGYYVEAEKALKRAIELKPAAYMYSNLGSLYAEGLKQTDNAIEAFKKALELEAHNAGTCFALGQLYLRKGDIDQARSYYSLATKLDPKNPLAWSALAEAERGLRRFDEATAAGRRAVENDKKNTVLKLALADIYASAGKEGDAGYWYKLALKESPKLLAASWQYGMFLQAHGHGDEADVQYATVLEIDPRHAGAWNNRASLALERPDGAAKAVEYANRAAEIAPRSANVLETLGAAQLKAGDKTAARKTLEKALAEEPNFPTAQFRLAQVNIADGRKSDAAKLLREALASKVDFPERKSAEELLKTVGG